MEPTRDLHRIAVIIHSVAKNYVRLDPEKLKPLAAMRDNIDAELPDDEMAERNRAVLRRFDDEEMVEALLDLPERLRKRFVREKAPTRLSAARLESALALALLTEAPIRVSNLARIRLGENLLKVGGRVHLVFPASEVKNKKKLEFVLQPATASLVDLYVRKARPKLLQSSSPYLFPGRVNGHKQLAHMSAQLAKLTAEEIGVRITAHQFRHIGGYLYLQQYPGDYEVVRQLLGHKKIETTMQFYCGMEREAAVRVWDRCLEERRSKPRSARAAW